MNDPFSVLGVSPEASLSEIHKAYRRSVNVIHPDRFDREKDALAWEQANKMYLQLNLAYSEAKRIAETRKRGLDDTVSLPLVIQGKIPSYLSYRDDNENKSRYGIGNWQFKIELYAVMVTFMIFLLLSIILERISGYKIFDGGINGWERVAFFLIHAFPSCIIR